MSRRSGGSVWLYWLCSLWLMCLSGCIESEPDRAFEVRRAEFTVLKGPDAGRVTQVTLPDGWDYQRPPRSGLAEYRFDVPRQAFARGQPSLYLPKVGNAFEVYVQGREVFSSGGFGEQGGETRRSRPQLVPLGPLPAGDPVRVVIRLEGGSLTLAGLSHVFAGDRAQLERAYLVKSFFYADATLLVAVACLSMGLLALLVWTRVRDPLYLLFGLAAVIWAWRTSTPGQTVLWMTPWLWSYVFLASYGWFVALISLYVVGVCRLQWQGWPRLLWGYFGVVTVFFALAVLFNWHFLRTIFNTLNLAIVIALCVALVWQARRQPSQELTLLGGAGLLTLLAGGRDWWMNNFDADRYANQTWARYAVLSFMAVMAWMLVDRLVKLQRETAQLNLELEDKVRQREAELAALFERQREQDMVQAATSERERIVREMHDGIGGQLMTVLRGVERGAFSQERVAEVLQESLDDLRLIIDASSAHRELVPALAAWRHRWDARLEALGIDLDWSLDDALMGLVLPPDTVLQIMRILQEAVINAVKHARTSRIQVEARALPKGLQLRVGDFGAGFDVTALDDPSRSAGRHGLKSMRARAQAIGATLSMLSAPGQGTTVLLVWPAMTGSDTPSVDQATP
ncbi:MAG TPA: ATP-binding protein [Aquabacterium sp.]|uniref:sensor histidine kinase n=1 Tax=Aquabacterium sp. TaxID=1872578 RepID=UPI002E371D8B|nr:ATP-binding protein [Aquabacterium sp.]HEX5371522.1 ATP-binding protein [Aquabacterium sp.]